MGCQASTCPAPTGDSTTLQSAALLFLFPVEQSCGSGELQTSVSTPCSSCFYVRAGTAFPRHGSTHQDIGVGVGGSADPSSQPEASGSIGRDHCTSPFTFGVSTPRHPWLLQVSTVQLTGAWLPLLRIPHSPALTKSRLCRTTEVRLLGKLWNPRGFPESSFLPQSEASGFPTPSTLLAQVWRSPTSLALFRAQQRRLLVLGCE